MLQVPGGMRLVLMRYRENPVVVVEIASDHGADRLRVVGDRFRGTATRCRGGSAATTAAASSRRRWLELIWKDRARMSGLRVKADVEAVCPGHVHVEVLEQLGHLGN